MFDIIIIGAGVVGAMIARTLAKYKISVLVIEKENDVGDVTSMANSAIIHAGYDPKPHSLKARLNVQGCAMYGQIAQDLDVHFDRMGSIVVAAKDEMDKLLALKDRAALNGVKVRLLNRDELFNLEPNLSPSISWGLLAEDAGVIDPFNLVVHAMENAIDNGVELHLNEKVESITVDNHTYFVTTDKTTYEARVVINAAGMNADAISAMVNKKYFDILPRKGEYFVVDHFDNNYLNHVIFPLPSEKGKGILMTPTSSHNYLIGPSSAYCQNREAVDTDKNTLDEVKAQISHLMSNIPFNQIIRTFTGVRPTSNADDFIIDMPRPGFINVAGIESPGLASAPAIAQFVDENFVQTYLGELSIKENYEPQVKKYIIPRLLDFAERDALIKNNPRYGHIICRCEQVSEGEILDALERSCPPHSVKGLKKRTRASFGKCQGGMCQPGLMRFLANYYHISPTEVVYDQLDTKIAQYMTKGGK